MENKIKFATAYNPNKQVRSKLDRRDNVNRVSYVDSTEYVRRMISEGQNLIEHRAKAMRSGLYSSDDAVKVIEYTSAIPVYETDPVIATNILNEYKDELKSHLGASVASAGSSSVDDKVVSFGSNESSVVNDTSEA